MNCGIGALLLPTLILIGQLEAKNLVGGARCTQGPAYWCSALQTSSECGATSYCIQEQWKSNPYPKDDDQVCKICKQMVQEAKDQLESNETQNEIKEVFEGSCNLIPIKIIADECKKLADEFIVQLIDTLASEMNPDTVCAVAGLCNSARIDNLLNHYLMTGGKFKTDCDVCHEQANKISLKIGAMRKDDVLDKGLELCGHLSSYSDACKINLLEFFDLIYDQLTHLDFLCESSGMCSESFNDSPSMISDHRGDSLECEFCEKVIQHWVDQWKANTTQEEFKEVLEEICKKLGQPDRIKRCLHIVDDYYIPFFEYILNSLNPHAVCASVGLCGPGGLLKVNPGVSIDVMIPHDASPEQISLAIPDDIEFGRDEVASADTRTLVGGYFAPQAIIEMNRPGCVICEFVLYRLREWLQDEHTKDEMEKELNDICEHMPSSLQDQCTNLVNTYGPAIIELIINNADPKLICSMLHLCEPEMIVDTFELTETQNPNPIKQMQSKNDNCATCQYVTSIVMKGIQNKDNQDEIKNVLDSVCTLLPSSISGKCENFINSYAEELMEMIADNLTPDEICQGLGLCERKKDKDDKCVICEFVIKTLDHMLEDHTNVEEIKRALEQVCMYLPKTVNKQCVNFVDTYTDMIADMIAHGVSPEEVCTELDLCSTQELHYEESESSEESSDEEEEKVEDASPFCMLCEYIIGEVDAIVENKQNEEEVRDVLDKVCDSLPNPMNKECASLVDTYLDKIIKMFAEDYTPDKICAALHLCEKKEMIEDDLPMTNDIPQFNAIGDTESYDAEVVADGQESSGICTLCEFGMSVLEKEVLNNRTLDMIERGVLMICSYLPESISEKCEKFVEEYGDRIISFLENEISPEEVCTELGVCAATQKWDATPVGGHRCDFGPSFWCQSMFHAKACGTVEFCQMFDWRIRDQSSSKGINF